MTISLDSMLAANEDSAPNFASTRERLLWHIESYCAAHGVSVSRFGREAVGDHKLVARLRKGQDIGISKADEVFRFIAANPDGLPKEEK